MLFRQAFSALRATRASSARQLARGYASAPAGGSSNLPLILGGLGVAGLGAWAYLERTGKAGDVKAAAAGTASQAAQEVKNTEAASPSTQAALVKDSWVPFTLTHVEKYNHNTSTYTFAFPGEDGKAHVSGMQVAGALLVKAPEGNKEPKDDKGKPVIRPYTPTSPADQTGSLQLLIKEYPTGKLTPYVASMKEGDQLLFKGPITKYLYKPNTFDKGLCVAGGSGITPMYQLISYALTLPEDKTKFTLLFSNVTEADILLRKEWDDLQKQHPDRLNVTYVLDKPPRGWKGPTGFVNADMISKAFPRKDGEKVMAFICGPPGQYAAVSGLKDGPRQGEVGGALKGLGYVKEEVFKF
ncbi:lipin Ned1 [Cryptotrichosporon argae]